MKISNETKVGALTAVAITVLILGFNYLKGKNITDNNSEIIAIFPSVEGLEPSNPVLIKGLQVGRVAGMKALNKDLTGVVVTIRMSQAINIPRNSVAFIDKSLLGSATLQIRMGDATELINDGDTLQSTTNPGMLDQVTQNINPAIDQVTKTLESLQVLIAKVTDLVDPYAKHNLQSTIANLNSATESLKQQVSANGDLGKTMGHLEALTATLERNNGKIDSTIGHLEKATGSLANADIEGVVTNLKGSLGKLESILSKMESSDGTLGALLNDRQLYDEIRQTNRSLNTLLDDFRVHPKRYVNISVFGKKDKSGPLKSPVDGTEQTNQNP